MKNIAGTIRAINFAALALVVILTLIMLFTLPGFTLSGDVTSRIEKIENTTNIELAKQLSVAVIKAYASSQRSSNAILSFFLLLLIGLIPVFLSNWLLARKIEKYLKEEKANNEHA